MLRALATTNRNGLNRGAAIGIDHIRRHCFQLGSVIPINQINNPAPRGRLVDVLIDRRQLRVADDDQLNAFHHRAGGQAFAQRPHADGRNCDSIGQGVGAERRSQQRLQLSAQLKDVHS
jgi:hypothetical protein